MKLIQCLDLKEPLQNLSNKEITFKTAYKISRIVELVEKNITYYQQQYSKIIQEYAEHDSDGNIIFMDEAKTQIKLKDQTANECNIKISELNEVEIMDDIPLLDESELESLEITPKEVYFLMPLIKSE